MQTNPDTPLREICFDFAAGMFDRSKFLAQVQASLRRRMCCDEVLIRCCGPDVAPLLQRLRGVGWLAEVVDDQQRLHAALAQNGRLIGVLSCVRDVTDPCWTTAEGVALRRHATTISSHVGCPPDGVEALTEEGERV